MLVLLRMMYNDTIHNMVESFLYIFMTLTKYN